MFNWLSFSKMMTAVNAFIYQNKVVFPSKKFNNVQSVKSENLADTIVRDSRDNERAVPVLSRGYSIWRIEDK